MKLVFASNNKNKINEIQNMLPANIQILSLKDIDCNEEIPETAATIEGNAILKANYVTQNYGYNCFADDTGLEVEALNGAPGVYSARYAGENKNADDNMNKLLDALKNEPNRIAQFKTIIALNINGVQILFEGIAKGNIINEKRGEKGFGYDPVFVPDGIEATFAEIDSEQKNQISHRGIAVQKLIKHLKTIK
jgi:XTP/dITP diphosphohydrolase